MPLVITDLDNTLYDWVTFFAKAFVAMVDELSLQIGVDREQLYDEFRDIHQKYGNTEQPYAILELPSVGKHFNGISRRELLAELDGPLHRFNSVRKHNLVLYQSVRDTLLRFSEIGVTVVGYTEAHSVNAYYRLVKLEIAHLLKRLYAAESFSAEHPDPERERQLEFPRNFLRETPKSERKPNPRLLFDICRQEGYSLGEVWYVGDSIVRDVSMAKSAGVKAIWARYGTDYDRDLWNVLVRVTHWSEEDVVRENELRSKYSDVKPDYTIDSFGEMLALVMGDKCELA